MNVNDVIEETIAWYSFFLSKNTQILALEEALSKMKLKYQLTGKQTDDLRTEVMDIIYPED